MAVIGKLRKHSALIVILVGIAIAGFVLQDLFTGGKGGRRSNEIFAKIGSEKLSKIDFDKKVDEQVEYYKQQAEKENLTSEENFQLMVQTWNQMEKELIMQHEYEELGLAIEHDKSNKPSISPEELYELMMGKNLHPYIIRSFTDPNTGKVNTQQIQNIITNFDQLKDDEKKQWKQLEQGIKDDRLATKYNNLVEKAYYMPKVFLQRQINEASKTANLRCYGIKYQTISDSAVTVTDDDMKKYYEEHKHEFEQENARDIDYVVFDVLPSKEDLAQIQEKVDTLFKDFQALDAENIENFIKANSDAPYDSNFYKKGSLPVFLDSIMFNAPLGTIVPPYVDNNSYFMARLMQIQNRPDSVKASQLLVAYKDAPNPLQNITRTKEQAKRIIDSLLVVANADKNNFPTLASINSDFPTAKQDGGDLGWIIDGNVETKFFFDSAYNSPVGNIKVIQSTMGYHLLYVADKKASMKKVKVAILQHDIKASSETFNKYLADASAFAGESRNTEQFNKNIADKGLNKRQAQFVKEMDYTLPGLTSAREIIRWAFYKETEKGMVSEQVYDCEGKYVVAMLVEKREKGIAPLDQVKTYIEPLVKREKKADQIIQKINATAGASKDINQIAAKMSTPVDTVNALTFSAYNFPKFGPEPELIGTIFTLKKNTLSAPIKGKMAVYQVWIDDISQAAGQINPDMMQMQLASYFRQRVRGDQYGQSELFNAIKKQTEITDNRIFYY
ncbi:MAG TPA: peptidylprolyl isomerase [Bacteroidales bacterium]|nr:peptidylprolyl isomerase [Bacteroidales bacterium]HNZ42553.1 peptidylprolyl isomerase [Bacteroidales bacterium]HOH83435.1 peptidylprolyl isomerase [Bacteroidales bacterium]HPB25911.1 peptidylprolyl isomerase [Bacteroidales bacterium]HPI29038.1 peptidylprolyl isomerase [Bacteroidales bacterium]